MSDADSLNPIRSPAITDEDRRQARNELHSLQDRTEIFCICDLTGRVLDIGGAFETITGHTPSALVGRPLSDVVVEEDMAATLEVAAILQRDNEVRTLCNRYRRADGSIRHILWTCVLSPNKALIYSIGRDVTELNEATATVKTRATLLEMAGKIAMFGGWSMDLLTDELTWSDEIHTLLDHNPSKSVHSLEESLALFETSSRTRAAQTLQSCRDTGDDFDIELQMVTSKGRLIDVRMTGKCERDASDQPIRVVGAIQDITAQKQTLRELERLAYFDHLTGLANRQQLLDQVEAERGNCTRRRQQAALLCINIDDFKLLNHSRSHSLGDQLLTLVAHRLEACARPGDLVARIDGDNFMMLMRGLESDPQRAAEQARNMCQRLQASLTEPYRLKSLQHRITVSIGIALYGMPAQPTESLLQRANLALQAVKARGGQASQFFDPGLQHSVSLRAEMEAALRDAIDGDELVLHYEPQVLANGKVVAAEALLRWQHPDKGLIGPGDFIPLAESSGLMVPLGRHVLKRACAQLALWQSDPRLSSLRMAVNVSPSEFRHTDFVDQALAIIEHSGIDPRQLTLELTESLLLENVPEIIERMQLLKAHGIHFALDDFGTGYSSLSYLQQLPLDQLKLDMSFVRRLPDDPRTAAIVRTIITLGFNLGLDLVAEGVETEAQRSFLFGEGCHCFQGHLFAPSQEAHSLARWLASRD